jgi:hypothetical protein
MRLLRTSKFFVVPTAQSFSYETLHPMPRLSNPYGPYDPKAHKEVSGQIPFHEWQYLKQHYPMLNGLFSGIISTLFHRFLQHYRTLEKDNGQPFEPAWYPGCPGYFILDTALERCNFDNVGELKRELARVSAELLLVRDQLQRATAGRTSGPGTPSDDTGTALSICPTVQCPPLLGPDPESRTQRGLSEAGSD